MRESASALDASLYGSAVVGRRRAASETLGLASLAVRFASLQLNL
jgi:hypothetical protein